MTPYQTLIRKYSHPAGVKNALAVTRGSNPMPHNREIKHSPVKSVEEAFTRDAQLEDT